MNDYERRRFENHDRWLRKLEDRLYRLILKLEPSVGPWGVRTDRTAFVDHLGLHRGHVTASFHARGMERLAHARGGSDLEAFRINYLQSLMIEHYGPPHERQS